MPKSSTGRNNTGQTKSAGWEMGARRTVAAPLDRVWAHLTGPGLTTWLGDTELPDAVGGSYETDDGIRGELRSRHERQKLRLTWKPPRHKHDTTLQLTVVEAATGTTIGFHHEGLSGRDERKTMLTHWHSVLEDLEDQLLGRATPPPRASAS